MYLIDIQKFSSKDYYLSFLKMFIPYIIFFFSPIVPALFLVGALVFADFITGTTAAKKRGEKINSSGYQRSVVKCIMYFIAILLSRGMEVVFFEWIPVTSITAGYIALTEFKSNIENISEYTGNNIWDAIKDRILPKDNANK